MTKAASFALAAFALFAPLDWIAIGRRRKSLEYVAKPGALAALVAVALTLEPASDPRRWAFVVALALSLLGDVFLMLPMDAFIAGVGAFFCAHLAYIVGMRIAVDTPIALVAFAAVAVGAFAMFVGRRIVAAVREREPALATPVSAYVAVISVMVASAIATRNPVAAVGAIVFMASDTLIAWNRFVQSLAWAPVTIMVTYHLGQLALVLSLLRR